MSDRKFSNSLLHYLSFCTLIMSHICDKEKNQCIREKRWSQNIVEEIKQYQKKWLQHVQRMDTNRIPKQALRYRSKGRRDIGRPKKRWRDQLHFEDQGTENTPNPSWTWWWWWWSVNISRLHKPDHTTERLAIQNFRRCCHCKPACHLNSMWLVYQSMYRTIPLLPKRRTAEKKIQVYDKRNFTT